jgi:HD-like signal output (HDOD) protein
MDILAPGSGARAGAPAGRDAPFDAWLAIALRRVAPISPWALKLLSMSPDAEGNDARLRDLVASDPALLARVLGTANTRAFNPQGHEVADVGHAIRRLGSREVWRLATVLALGASSRIRPELRGARRALWTHSFTVAHAARMLAEAAGRPEANPDRTFVCGLLHDIGLMVLLTVEPDRCVAMLARLADPTAGTLADIEAEAGLPPHARIGEAVCRRWGLPVDLAVLVGSHGRVHPLDMPAEHRAVAAALELGHQVAERTSPSTQPPTAARRDDAPLLRTFLRIDATRLERIADAVREAGPRIAAVAQGA